MIDGFTFNAGGPKALVVKLAQVMAAVERVPKNGYNAFHKYHYATEADIMQAVRSAMAEARCMLIPTIEQQHWRDPPPGIKGGPICQLVVAFTLLDGDSGEALSFRVLGEGQDGGDKATYKAMTGATKYALLKLFLISTGDDPEADGGGQAQQGGQQQRPAQQTQGGQRQQASSQRPAQAPGQVVQKDAQPAAPAPTPPTPQQVIAAGKVAMPKALYGKTLAQLDDQVINNAWQDLADALDAGKIPEAWQPLANLQIAAFAAEQERRHPSSGQTVRDVFPEAGASRADEEEDVPF